MIKLAKISETDQAGKVTAFEYNVKGSITKVIDSMGSETVFEYDGFDNLIAQTDAEEKPQDTNTINWEEKQREFYL